jgi:hypothetical protein
VTRLCLLDVDVLVLLFAVLHGLDRKVNVRNLCIVAVKDTGNLLKCGATRGKVSFDTELQTGEDQERHTESRCRTSRPR